MLEVWVLCPTISVTFQNWWPGCVGWERSQGLNFSLFFHSWHGYFCHFSCAQLRATLCLPGQTVWKWAPLFPFLNDYRILPLSYDSLLVTSPWSVAVRKSYNHFCLDKVRQHITQTNSFQAYPDLNANMLQLRLHIKTGETLAGFYCEAVTGNTVYLSTWLALTMIVHK